jgi:uncharacterized membrane protein
MEKRRWTNEEIVEYRKTHGSFGYFNRNDTRVFVPRTYGFGIAVNWANPWTWVIVAAVVAIGVLMVIYY